MATTLERRIDALERKATPHAGFPDTIIISFLAAKDGKNDIRKLRADKGGNVQEWERGNDESEQELIDRASKEVSRNAGGIAMLFQDN